MRKRSDWSIMNLRVEIVHVQIIVNEWRLSESEPTPECEKVGVREKTIDELN